MTVESKFDIGDEVFFMHKNKVCFKEVKGIHFGDAFKNNIGQPDKYPILYKFYYEHEWVKVEEKNVYKTKEELLSNL